MQKDHSVAENIQMNIRLINFSILLGLSLTSICPTNDIKQINNNHPVCVFSTVGGVQYRGGYLEYRGVFSTVGDIMINVGIS